MRTKQEGIEGTSGLKPDYNDHTINTRLKTTLIAVGNCGYNIANDIVEAGIITPADYLVCDTNVEELQYKIQDKKCKTITLPSFEGNPDTGLLPLAEGIVPEETDLVMICAGMGGQTGSRYAPLIGMSAQILNKIVISIFATAFRFEGEKAQTRSKWGFLQQQIASDFCIYQDNNCLLNESGPDEINKPVMTALKILKQKYPIWDWPDISASEFKKVIIETARNSCPVMTHNFYSKKFIDLEDREKMFNEVIAVNP